MYNQFDRVPSRKGTCSVKWNRADKKFGGTDLLPMWVADMDFPVAPGVKERLRHVVDTGDFGYCMLSRDYYEAVAGWMERRHGYHVEPEWICYSDGVVTGLRLALEAITEVGDEVLIPTPVYGPFFHTVESLKRVAVCCPLRTEGGRYTFDFTELERRVTPKTRALMLCSPHNPVGRVWERVELETLAAFCLRHNLIVIADEIHHDLVYRHHTVFPTVSPEIAQRTILCTAPSKTFNIAGIQASNLIIQNLALREKVQMIMAQEHITPNSFVQAAVLGAYQDSGPWLDQLLSYLEGNIDLFCSTLATELPKLKVCKPEGTYLAWVDCAGLGLTPEMRRRLFVEQCGLAVNDGGDFGEEGRDFVRVNLACPRATVEECLCRLKEHCR